MLSTLLGVSDWQAFHIQGLPELQSPVGLVLLVSREVLDTVRGRAPASHKVACLSSDG